jgi:hypothetical protein
MGGGIAALVAARHPQLVQRVALLDAAGVRFDDNQFGIDVLAGHNPFAVTDASSLQRYIDTVFHRPQAKPWIPWPASRGFIAKRRGDAAFEQSVLDEIGRGPEQFVPGDEAANIRQPALLLWGAPGRGDRSQRTRSLRGEDAAGAQAAGRGCRPHVAGGTTRCGRRRRGHAGRTGTSPMKPRLMTTLLMMLCATLALSACKREDPAAAAAATAAQAAAREQAAEVVAKQFETPTPSRTGNSRAAMATCC